MIILSEQVFKTNEDGQVEIDFLLLEEATSNELVKEVQSVIRKETRHFNFSSAKFFHNEFVSSLTLRFEYDTGNLDSIVYFNFYHNSKVFKKYDLDEVDLKNIYSMCGDFIDNTIWFFRG